MRANLKEIGRVVAGKEENIAKYNVGHHYVYPVLGVKPVLSFSSYKENFVQR